jgi:hypothetical protein
MRQEKIEVERYVGENQYGETTIITFIPSGYDEILYVNVEGPFDIEHFVISKSRKSKEGFIRSWSEYGRSEATG